MDTSKKIRIMTEDMKPCQCGGQLCVGKSIKINKKGIVHLKIKCRECGAWHGGVTIRDQSVGGS